MRTQVGAAVRPHSPPPGPARLLPVQHPQRGVQRALRAAVVLDAGGTLHGRQQVGIAKDGDQPRSSTSALGVGASQGADGEPMGHVDPQVGEAVRRVQANLIEQLVLRLIQAG